MFPLPLQFNRSFCFSICYLESNIYSIKGNDFLGGYMLNYKLFHIKKMGNVLFTSITWFPFLLFLVYEKFTKDKSIKH